MHVSVYLERIRFLCYSGQTSACQPNCQRFIIHVSNWNYRCLALNSLIWMEFKTVVKQTLNHSFTAYLLTILPDFMSFRHVLCYTQVSMNKSIQFNTFWPCLTSYIPTFVNSGKVCTHATHSVTGMHRFSPMLVWLRWSDTWVRAYVLIPGG